MNNVNQMAKATNVTGQVHDELEETSAAARCTAERVGAAIDGLSLS